MFHSGSETCLGFRSMVRYRTFEQGIADLEISIEDMKAVLDKIKPEHLAMMQNVTLKFSLLDLTPDMLRKIDKDLETRSMAPSRAHYLRQNVSLPSRKTKYRHTTNEYGTAIRQELHNIWEQKLDYTRSGFPGVEKLLVQLKVPWLLDGGWTNVLMSNRNGNGRIERYPGFEVDPYRSHMTAVTGQQMRETNLALVISQSSTEWRAIAKSKIGEIGWDKFKRWIGTEAAQVAAQ